MDLAFLALAAKNVEEENALVPEVLLLLIAVLVGGGVQVWLQPWRAGFYANLVDALCSLGLALFIGAGWIAFFIGLKLGAWRHRRGLQPAARRAIVQVEVDESVECRVCLDAEASHAIVPCGHLCVCSACLTTLTGGCPMCRGDIEGCLRVYRP